MPDVRRKSGERELLPGTLEMLILETLRRGALHGYAIAQYIQQTSGDVLQVEEDRYIRPCNGCCEKNGWRRSGGCRRATDACGRTRLRLLGASNWNVRRRVSSDCWGVSAG